MANPTIVLVHGAFAVFSWSYRHLTPQACRLFRLLSLQPAADITVAASASLLGDAPETTNRLMAELTSTALITEHQPGRYAFHELTRAYAAELSDSTDTDRDRHEALARLDGIPPMNLFGALVFQVTGQQLSVASRRRILGRIQEMFGSHLPSPAELLQADPAGLRQAGLSGGDQHATRPTGLAHASWFKPGHNMTSPQVPAAAG
jgi:hypothetical protein